MDAKYIINLGLGHLGEYSISSLDPPNSSMARRMALYYPHWKRSELTRRRWVFNRGYAPLAINPLASQGTAERPYGYSLPTDYLGAVRSRSTRWQMRGKMLYSPSANEVLEYKRDVPETEFDPLFVDVLAVRIALENAEYVTQSNLKKADVAKLYQETVRLAAAQNALIIGSEDAYETDDFDDDWVRARMGLNF